MESSRRLEFRIKGAQGPPLHTGSPPVVDDSETSDAKPEKIEEIFIKEEYVEETPLDTNRAFLDPISLSETISAEPHNQLHKDRLSQNILLHIDTNADNIEEIFIKEERIEERPQTKEFYNNILKEECVNNLVNEDTDGQPEDNTEDESATFNTSGEGSSSNTKKITHKTENQTERNESETNARIERKDSLSCSACNKKFKFKSLLIHHMKIHSAVREFKCEICSKEFIFKHHLADHIKSHSNIREFQCKICEKSFTQKSNLTSHMRTHYIIYEFQCDICEKSFSQKSALTRHMKIHSEVKNFQCNVCSRKFLHKHNLVTHMKLHSRI